MHERTMLCQALCVAPGSLVSIAMPCQLNVLALQMVLQTALSNILRSSFGIADHLPVTGKADFRRGGFRRHETGEKR